MKKENKKLSYDEVSTVCKGEEMKDMMGWTDSVSSFCIMSKIRKTDGSIRLWTLKETGGKPDVLQWTDWMTKGEYDELINSHIARTGKPTAKLNKKRLKQINDFINNVSVKPVKISYSNPNGMMINS